ncbi:MAG: transposase [Deltaproteobacteria bacterium]|nr:transposase [Deltaproteobacteria bacterium]
MRTRYKTVESGAVYFMTSTIVEWIPIFTSSLYCDVIIDSLKYCMGNKGLKICAYAIMDNHIHLVASGEKFPLVMKDFKSYTARGIIQAAQIGRKDWLLNQLKFYKRFHKTGSEHQVWQEGFHSQEITTEEMLRQKIEYIHNNPLRRGLVERPEHWSYSSASNYISGAGRLDVDLIGV